MDGSTPASASVEAEARYGNECRHDWGFSSQRKRRGRKASTLDAPLSEAAVRSGALRAAGGVASMVTARAAEAALTLPATSVAVVLML